jgi:hypothetical protein
MVVAHWSDDIGLDHEDWSLIRPYTITRGRTAAAQDDLTLISVVTALHTDSGESGLRPRELQPEHRAVLGLCREPKAVAEIAADMNLPISVTKILIGDLIAAGRVQARPPLAFAYASGFPDITILEAVRDGLRRL